MATENTELTLRGGNTYGNYSSGSFSGGSWSIINLGTLAYPLDAMNLNNWAGNRQMFGGPDNASTIDDLVITQVNVTYNPNSITSTSEIEDLLAKIMDKFELQVAANPNFIHYLTSTAS